MNKHLLDYNKIAQLFVFPQGNDFEVHAKEVQQYLNLALAEAGNTLQAFTDTICSISKVEQEELYLRTFEIQSITSLDVGYIVFGDDYKRGELLVNLNREHKTYGIDCANELADNLANILRLLNVLKDNKLRKDLAQMLIIPALDKMIKCFGSDQIKAKEKVYLKHHKTLLQKHKSFTIYRHALKALRMALVHDFHIKTEKEARYSDGFLNKKKVNFN